MTKEEFKKKFGYDLESVEALRVLFKNQRKKKENTWRLIDAYDSGKFWDTLRAKLPAHQIIPDTNWVFYIKDNIVNSTFAAPYIADVVPLDPGVEKKEEDQQQQQQQPEQGGQEEIKSTTEGMDLARQINKFVEFEYNRKELGYKQLTMGSRAASKNVGFLQLAWNDSATLEIGGTKNKGEIDYITRDPMAILLDPNFEEFQEGRAAFILTEDNYEDTVANYPDARLELEKLFKSTTDMHDDTATSHINISSQSDVGKGYYSRGVTPLAQGMVTIYIAFKKTALDKGGYRIDQVIYTDTMIILEAKSGIKPNYFPIIPLFSYPPEGDGYGTGKVERIMRNALALNILDSISVTHTYAAQRTPVVIDTRTGLLPDRVAQDLNRPDRIFAISEGNVKEAIHRLDFPELPRNLQNIAERLENSIVRVTGIDDKYTGRDTASVTTTGGMERLQQRVTMTDNTHVQMIEKYARELTRMILDFYIIKGGTRRFSTFADYNNSQREILDIDFEELKKVQFSYHINASPLLPKNRQRLAEAANQIMEFQMQYQSPMKLLSEEEWLYFQDFPQKDMMLDRMKLERLRNDYEDIEATLVNFSAMTEGEGMAPEKAIQQLADEKAVQREPGVMQKQLLNKK